MPRGGMWLAMLVLLFGCSDSAVPREPGADEPASAYFIDMETMRQLALKGAQFIDVRRPSLFMRLHIPGAISVGWRTFADGDDSGVLLNPIELRKRIADLKLDPERAIVVIGSFDEGWGEEGRIAWLLRGMGLPRVFILKGGFKQWERLGGAGANGLSVPLRGTYEPIGEPTGNATAVDVEASVTEGALLLDVRTRSEFDGATPYGSARGGHIKGSINFPFAGLFSSGSLQSSAQIRANPALEGLAADHPIITYCTGGVRSAFVACVLADAGFTNVRNYSGSWWEWSKR